MRNDSEAPPIAAPAPACRHVWEPLNGVAGWFGCVRCGVVGICPACLPHSAAWPASWGLRMSCERHQGHGASR